MVPQTWYFSGFLGAAYQYFNSVYENYQHETELRQKKNHFGVSKWIKILAWHKRTFTFQRYGADLDVARCLILLNNELETHEIISFFYYITVAFLLNYVFYLLLVWIVSNSNFILMVVRSKWRVKY